MNVGHFFHMHPVFRFEEFASWKAQQGPIKAASVHSALAYYVKTGKLKQIRRHIYAVILPNQTSKGFVDSYLVAGKATRDSVLAYHTALELLGLAYSSFGQLTYLTQQKSKSFAFEAQFFRPVAHPYALSKKAMLNVGVMAIERQGVTLNVTNAARTFVDVLDRVELSGGWEEVYRSISNLAVLNIDEVINYCLALDNALLNAKVGYFLSLRREAFAATTAQLERLQAFKPKAPQYASKRGQDAFRLVKEWNVLLPTAVVDQQWEEPNDNV